MIQNNFALYDAHGDIQQVGYCPDEMVPLQAREGLSVYAGAATLNDRVNPATGELIVGGKPERPSLQHHWDAASGAWVPDLAAVRELKRQAIEAERDRRIYAPIVYDGKTLDGFRASQDNLKSKLATIAQREALGLPDMAPELLVWRDAANVTHTFASQAAYKAWLGGWAIALEERGTLAYAWSWARKAQLDALSTYEELAAFEP